VYVYAFVCVCVCVPKNLHAFAQPKFMQTGGSAKGKGQHKLALVCVHSCGVSIFAVAFLLFLLLLIDNPLCALH